MVNWFHLPHLAGLRISGEDARALVHAQFTSSFKSPAPGFWHLTSWCSPKGRVLFVILARADEQHVDLILPAVQMAELSQRLKMYSIGRQVSLMEIPHVAGAFSATDETASLAVDRRRSLQLEPAQASADGEAAEQWRQRDLQAGIAWLTADTSARFLPQSLGLEERGGLSYDKGCYPGQEIVARVHYLGKVKERLVGFRVEAGAAAPGTDTDQTVLVDRHGTTQGHVLCIFGAAGQQRGLAVVSAELADDAALYRAGAPVQVLKPELL